MADGVVGTGVGSSTLSDVGEFGLISQLVAHFDQGEHVLIGPGDDAALLRIKNGHVVVSTDLLIEGRHFRREWASAADIGHRAAAQNLSDINAMGGTAHSLTLGLGLPGDLPVAWVLEFAQGFAAEAALVGASVVGGDITRSDSIVIAVTVMGSVKQAPVLRSGAKPGNILALAGRQGWAAAGLAVLGRGFRSPRAVVAAFQRPEPPYSAGPEASEAGATSMIDISDGLVAEARHIAIASGVAIDLETEALPVPDAFHAVAMALNVEPMSFVLAGGEDHPIMATFPAGAELPEGFVRIGTVSAPGEAGVGVTVDGEPYEGPAGWTHF